MTTWTACLHRYGHPCARTSVQSLWQLSIDTSTSHPHICMGCCMFFSHYHLQLNLSKRNTSPVQRKRRSRQPQTNRDSSTSSSPQLPTAACGETTAVPAIIQRSATQKKRLRRPPQLSQVDAGAGGGPERARVERSRAVGCSYRDGYLTQTPLEDVQSSWTKKIHVRPTHAVKWMDTRRNVGQGMPLALRV